MMYSSEHSRVRLYTWTRYVSAACGIKMQKQVEIQEQTDSGHDNRQHIFSKKKNADFTMYLEVLLLVAGDAQGEDGARACCMTNGFVSVFH